MVDDVVLAKKRDDVRQAIAEKNIILAKDLPNEKSQFEGELRSEQVKLNMITPLELVGRTTATDRPVRPRKPRALSILTILALFGGIGLAHPDGATRAWAEKLRSTCRAPGSHHAGPRICVQFAMLITFGFVPIKDIHRSQNETFSDP